MAAIDGSSSYRQIDWLSIARKALEEEGISTDTSLDADFLRQLADMLRRAAIENAWRTERAISGSPFDSRDSYFDTFHADSPMPTPAKARRTVGDLRREFLADVEERAKAGNLRPSSVKAAQQNTKVMIDFFGRETDLASITKKTPQD